MIQDAESRAIISCARLFYLLHADQSKLNCPEPRDFGDRRHTQTCTTHIQCQLNQFDWAASHVDPSSREVQYRAKRAIKHLDLVKFFADPLGKPSELNESLITYSFKTDPGFYVCFWECWLQAVGPVLMNCLARCDSRALGEKLRDKRAKTQRTCLKIARRIPKTCTGPRVWGYCNMIRG